MPYSKISFMSQQDVGDEDGRDDTIVISITDPGLPRARLQSGFKDVLFLEFDNTESLLRHGQRFSLDNANAVLAFVAKHELTASRIVVNCMMGESRSAAVAKFLAGKYNVALTQPCDKALDWVFRVLFRIDRAANDILRAAARSTDKASALPL